VRARLALILAVAGLFLAAGPASAAQQVLIREVDPTEYPKISVTVSTSDETALNPDNLSLQENGNPVEALDVQTFSETGGRVDVVLVIDTSGSMQGAPMAAAIDAARNFVANVPDNVRVGLITFSDSAKVAVPITTDRTEALSVISNLKASGETALYDALAKAADMFSSSAQRNVVLLSDGEDTVSSSTFKSAVADVEDSESVVFAVGLESPDFDGTTLRQVAAATKGEYSPAASANLSKIYDILASQLSNQFVVTYESTAAENSQVSVSVNAAGSTDSALFLVGTREPVAPKTLENPEQNEPLLKGTAGLVIVIGLFFSAAFLMLWMLIGGTIRNRHNRWVARRLAGSAVGAKDGDSEDRDNVASWIPESFVEAGDRVAQATGYTQRLDEKLERAALKMKAGEFMALSGVAAVFGFCLGVVFFQKFSLALVLGLVGAFVPSLVLSVIVSRRCEAMQKQLPDIMAVIASSLRAGHSFMQSLDMVAKEIDDPARDEFARMVTEIRLGRPATDALNAMAERMDSDDMKWAVLAVNIQREVGGNLAELLDTVAHTIRERETIRRQVKVLSAEGKLSVYILTGLPMLIALYIAIVNPTYLALLWTTKIGLVMTVLASTLLVVGIAWMRKVVKIDV
jgi:tight adherence protein B